MFSMILLVVSTAALLQFALYYRSAVLLGVAAQPVSQRAIAAAGIERGSVSANDFAALAGIHHMVPELERGTGGLGLVQHYYNSLAFMAEKAGERFPALANWNRRERELCARYAAVLIDRRMHASLALAASIRSC